METKKYLVIVIIIILIASLIVPFLSISFQNNGSGIGRTINKEHVVLTNSGESGFPKIDENYIYWTSFTSNSIIRYDISSETVTELFPEDTKTNRISDIFLSNNRILYKIYIEDESDPFNLITKYKLFDTVDQSSIELYISGIVSDFQYPFVVYHNLTYTENSVESNLYLLDLSSDSTILIDHENWGKIDGDYIAYNYNVYDSGTGEKRKVHLYQISSTNNDIIMETEHDGLDILISSNKCIILETNDYGPGANTYIYSYDISKEDRNRIGEFNAWMFNTAYDGSYLFWSNHESQSASPYSDIMVMDTGTGTIDTGVKKQWIAGAASGSIDAHDGIAVWASEKQIHMLKIL
jgi:hypothetical protein